MITTTIQRMGLWTLVAVMLTACVSSERLENKQRQERAIESQIAVAMEYLRLDQPNNAKRNLANAMEIREDDPRVHNALAQYYRYLQDDKQEEHHLRRALRADKHYSSAHNNYGTLLARQQRYEEAVKQFQAAAEDLNYPGSGSAYANLGICYELMGKKDKALWAYNKANLLNSATPVIYLSMARLYLEEQRQGDAWSVYQQYVAEQNPQSAEGFWIGIRLAKLRNDADLRASYELALKNRYPDSAQYKAWQQWNGQQAKGGSGE